jgi:hypothetical protein
MRFYFKCKTCGCTTNDYNAGTDRAQAQQCYTCSICSPVNGKKVNDE